ncbi:MAG: J domain-containing protein [Chitinophagaceae bacterium]
MTNCYKILGVKDFASAEEVKTAYRKLSKKFHPDVNDGDKFFEERFKEIQNAYEILCDSRRKEIHDSKLKSTFSGSGKFNFKENDKTESKEEPKKEKSTTENRNDTKSNNKTEHSNTNTTTSDTYSKPESKPFNFRPIGIVVIVILVIVVIVSLNKKQQDTYSNKAIENTNSQSSTPDDYSNQTAQTPTYQSPETKTYDNQSSSSDEELSQPSSIRDGYFTIGSTKNEVLQVQGDPTGINKYEAMGEEVWSYGFSTVTFKRGLVSEYSNTSKNLKAKMTTSNKSQNNTEYFTVGSSKDEVLQAQGNPTGINKYEAMDEEVWSYGFSTVTFKNGRVSEYSNTSRNLQAKMTTSNKSQSNTEFFTVGSSKDEVLQAQGNPTGINKYEAMDEEVWSYGFSTVTFKNGRVSEYSNTSRNLKVRL